MRGTQRFTAVEKWRDPWFRKLSADGKVLFLYLCDTCDLAGFVEIDIDSLRFHTGVNDPELAMEEISKSYSKSQDWVWIKKFLYHQNNLPLDPKNKAHIKIARILRDQWERFGEQISQITGVTEKKLIRWVGPRKGVLVDNNIHPSTIDGGSVGDPSPPCIGIGIGKGKSKGKFNTLVKEICEYWNSKDGLQKIIPPISTKRKAEFVRAIKNKFFLKNWRAGIDAVAETDWCTGVPTGKEGRIWHANIDWFLREGKVNEILERRNGKAESLDEMLFKSEEARKEWEREYVTREQAERKAWEASHGKGVNNVV